jgi:hypothetical protein
MRIAIITDAWYPQINGVVTTLASTRQELERLGHRVLIVTPGGFKTFPCPTYPEIRLTLWPTRTLRVLVEGVQTKRHTSRRRTLGLAARGYCVERGLPSPPRSMRFPVHSAEVLAFRPAMTYALLRWFHGRAKRTLVSTPSLPGRPVAARVQELGAVVARGEYRAVPAATPDFLSDERPIFTYLGRVAVEKNVARHS